MENMLHHIVRIFLICSLKEDNRGFVKITSCHEKDYKNEVRVPPMGNVSKMISELERTCLSHVVLLYVYVFLDQARFENLD